MAVSAAERELLRSLADRVAEIAALPIQQERAALIKGLNALRPERPVVLAFPEEGWRELVPAATLQCREEPLRGWEGQLRGRIFRHEHIGDDYPSPNFLDIGWVINHGDYGLAMPTTRVEERGSFHWEPPVRTRADFEKLHFRRPKVDRAATQRRVELAEEIFGDRLRVRVRGALYWTLGLTQTLIFLRGLEQMMLDMYDDPQLMHDLMSLLRDSTQAELDYYVREGLLTLNNGPDDYVGSGGLGYTDELPAAGFQGQARPADMWCLGESQETVGVSPAMFEEFVLPYQKPILERFGLVCYGCCEPIDRRLTALMAALPNLRRLSVSPWSDRAAVAEQIGGRYVFSWKPNPALVCAPTVDWELVEGQVRETLRLARGCAVEMILKDTHTFCGDPSRVGQWVRVALRAAEEAQ
jgi:hypothetical protein